MSGIPVLLGSPVVLVTPAMYVTSAMVGTFNSVCSVGQVVENEFKANDIVSLLP